MELSEVIERVRRVATVRTDAAGQADVAASALVDIRDIRAFLDASEAILSRRIASEKSFPEATIADASKGSLGGASKTLDRARTLDATPTLADALDDASVTAGHVDAVTRAGKRLEPEQRDRFHHVVEGLVDVAAAATIADFARRVRHEASTIAAADGMDRLARQQRATTLSTWVDLEGMWNLSGKFDPVTGVKLAARLELAVEALFAEAVPNGCPSDPIEKQKHVRALALSRLIDGGGTGVGRAGRPEFVAVIDVAATRVSEGSDPESDAGSSVQVQWPIPIEVPRRVLAELMDGADVTTVVIRNGIVLHAPGELNLGRTTRLANRAQRRALRGLYRSCALPGCTTSYDRCKLHHIIWWRNGGRTDLENLIPVCSHHHHKIHDAGWDIALGPNRQLTLTLPDRTIRNTGPPSRSAA